MGTYPQKRLISTTNECTFGLCDNQSSTQNFPKTELTHMMTTKLCSIFHLPFSLLILALVLHHHFRLPHSFGTDSDIVSQVYIPTLKVYLGKIVEFRQALIGRPAAPDRSRVPAHSSRRGLVVTSSTPTRRRRPALRAGTRRRPVSPCPRPPDLR